MPSVASQLILGSRSPRRLELLSLLIPRERIEVRTPSHPDEAGFAGLTTHAAIEQRLLEIARDKNGDVASQLPNSPHAILTADTTIVGTDDTGRLAVLGQPPEDASWPDVVRGWFRTYYLGRTHVALTAVCLRTPDGCRHEVVAHSGVTFLDADDAWLDWYIATGESRGKAGGYALQGAADVFVERIEGSPSNVVGLPLRETAELLRYWDAAALISHES
jgi:septum formation protein